MPKKDREDRKLKQIIAKCEDEYCNIHKRKKIARFVLTDRLRPIEVIPECPECRAEQEELDRQIAMSTRKVI